MQVRALSSSLCGQCQQKGAGYGRRGGARHRNAWRRCVAWRLPAGARRAGGERPRAHPPLRLPALSEDCRLRALLCMKSPPSSANTPELNLIRLVWSIRMPPPRPRPGTGSRILRAGCRSLFAHMSSARGMEEMEN